MIFSASALPMKLELSATVVFSLKEKKNHIDSANISIANVYPKTGNVKFIKSKLRRQR